MKLATTVSSLLAGCLTGSVAHAADLLVPKQFPTIQSAINSAANGDRVLVSPGAYHEQVNLSSKGIQLIGVGGAAVTAIDGDNTRTVIVGSGEPDTCLVQGFTIRNGRDFGYYNGGGVRLYNSSAAFTDCHFVSNRAEAPAWWGAGAFRSEYGNPRIHRCIFAGNSSIYTTADIYHYLGGSITISDCLFANSAAIHGSAIHIQNEGGSITMSISNCAFRSIGNTLDTTSADVCAPLFFHSPFGGTITGSVTNCTFECPLASPALASSRVNPFYFNHCGIAVDISGNVAQGFASWYLAESCGAVPITDSGSNILTPTCCPSDADASGTVDAVDLAILLAQWGDCIGCRADTTADDGTVEGKDLATLLSAWGVCQ